MVTGSQTLLVENLFRGRYRNGRERPAAMVPGEPVAVSFLIGHLAHRIPSGHRLALVVQGSNTPRWDVSAFADADPASRLADGIAVTEIGTAAGQPSRLRYRLLESR